MISRHSPFDGGLASPPIGLFFFQPRQRPATNRNEFAGLAPDFGVNDSRTGGDALQACARLSDQWKAISCARPFKVMGHPPQVLNITRMQVVPQLAALLRQFAGVE